jgi:hypothetical protein
MTPEERDALVEEIAAAVERPSLLDLSGIGARRKRDRQDAELRNRAREEQRREMAGLIRAFKTGEGWCPFTALQRIAEDLARIEAWHANPPTDSIRRAMGPAEPMWCIQDLTALAARRWIDAAVAVPLYSRDFPPKHQFIVTLTDAGRAALTEHMARQEGGKEPPT